MRNKKVLAEERNLNTPKVSVIMPTYNAQNTIIHAIKSVLNTPRYREIEIIVVDDCSKDDTINTVRNIQKDFNNIRLYIMPQNSGGPSAPRNLGIEKAKGQYITFLDDDDWFDAKRLMEMVDYALDCNVDFLKGYLIVVNGKNQSVHNRLPEIPSNTTATIKAIISHHSTNSDFLIKKEILIEKCIRYVTDLRIGEDTVFTVDILTNCQNVKYVDNYFMYHSNGSLDTSNVSSTQQCGDREINHQLSAWQIVQKKLLTHSLNYYQLRLHIGFRNLLLSIVRYSDGIGEDTYNRLHQFACETKNAISGKMKLHSRYLELYNAILSGNYEDYIRQSRTRLLINGYDLKFVLPIIPYLKKSYEIRVDEWTGHNSHDKSKSKSLAQWADIIWCEWLLGNAVFYSEVKNVNQRLIIRAHRFEITRDFGNCIDFDKVDMVLTVGFYYFEQFSNTFSIPKIKMRLLPNYVEEDIYSSYKHPDSIYHIGMVGILPSLKGFYKGLSILKMLKERNERFKLYIMGKSPDEVSWIQNNPTEADYYKECNKYIESNNLSSSVIYGGFVSPNHLYENIGYVLSLSDIESFHLAPSEGACTGSIGYILKWPGSEYIYPQTVLFSSIDDMMEAIYKCSQSPELFIQKNEELKSFIIENYSIKRFLENVHNYLKQLYLLR